MGYLSQSGKKECCVEDNETEEVLLYSASLCSLVIIKISNFLKNFSGDRIFLEVGLQRYGGKTYRDL